MVDFQVGGEDFGEAFDILAAPGFVHLAVLPKAAVHQIVVRFNADELKAVGVQFYGDATGDGLLCFGEERSQYCASPALAAAPRAAACRTSWPTALSSTAATW